MRERGYASSIAFNLAIEDIKRNAPECEKYIPEPVKVRHSKRCKRNRSRVDFSLFSLKRRKWRRSLLKFRGSWIAPGVQVQAPQSCATEYKEGGTCCEYVFSTYHQLRHTAPLVLAKGKKKERGKTVA